MRQTRRRGRHRRPGSRVAAVGGRRPAPRLRVALGGRFASAAVDLFGQSALILANSAPIALFER